MGENAVQAADLADRPRVKSAVAICPVPASGFKANDAAMQSLRAVIENDEAARKAIAARGGARYGSSWMNFKLRLARNASTREAMAGYLKMFTETDFAREANGTKTPILAIVGKHDIPFYREESVGKNFSALYPNFDLVVSEEAGHYPMLETPVFVAANIERHIVKYAG